MRDWGFRARYLDTEAGSILVRRTHLALLAAGLLVSLAACAPSDGSTDGATPQGCAPAGDASRAISVDGGFGALPQIAFEGPLEPQVTERTVLVEGEGDRAENGDTALIEYTVLNGETSAEIASTGFTGANAEEFPIDTSGEQLSGFSRLIECASPGTRVVGVIPPAEGFGDAGVPELELSGSESLVFVIDVVDILDAPLDRAEGEALAAPDDFPVVTLADTGEPTIVIPEQEPPSDFALAVTIQGDGEEVPAGADVTVHYTGINWNTGEVFDSSWARGTPAPFNVDQVIPGFRDALVGQSVGSQVIAIIPPDLGYGPSGGTPDGSIGAEDTIVFVVDILAAR